MSVSNSSARTHSGLKGATCNHRAVYHINGEQRDVRVVGTIDMVRRPGVKRVSWKRFMKYREAREYINA